MKISVDKFNKQLEDCREQFDKLPSPNLSKIPSWVASGMAIILMPKSLQNSYRIAIERQLELETEISEAKTMEMSLEEYRFYKAFPMPVLFPDIKDVINGTKTNRSRSKKS